MKLIIPDTKILKKRIFKIKKRHNLILITNRSIAEKYKKESNIQFYFKILMDIHIKIFFLIITLLAYYKYIFVITIWIF